MASRGKNEPYIVASGSTITELSKNVEHEMVTYSFRPQGGAFYVRANRLFYQAMVKSTG